MLLIHPIADLIGRSFQTAQHVHPHIYTQERAPIYSIDLHPDGTRFVTGANEVGAFDSARVI